MFRRVYEELRYLSWVLKPEEELARNYRQMSVVYQVNKQKV